MDIPRSIAGWVGVPLSHFPHASYIYQRGSTISILFPSPTTILMSPSSTLFTNVRLVGHPATDVYHVLVRNGLVDTISKQKMEAEGSSVIDLGTAKTPLWLAPSLVDHHTHFKFWSAASRRLNLYDAKSASEVFKIVRQALSDPGFDPVKDPVLVGQHMRVAPWQDLDDMCRQGLDSIDATRPIVLIFSGFHSICMNSAALERLGIKSAGHSGLLEEMPAFKAQTKLLELEDDIIDLWVAEAAQAAA